ncbi:unnamed protein product [Gadus morhua 'NCC']
MRFALLSVSLERHQCCTDAALCNRPFLLYFRATNAGIPTVPCTVVGRGSGKGQRGPEDPERSFRCGRSYQVKTGVPQGTFLGLFGPGPVLAVLSHGALLSSR